MIGNETKHVVIKSTTARKTCRRNNGMNGSGSSQTTTTKPKISERISAGHSLFRRDFPWLSEPDVLSLNKNEGMDNALLSLFLDCMEVTTVECGDRLTQRYLGALRHRIEATTVSIEINCN